MGIKMSERYILTGVQLAMLSEIDDRSRRKEIMEEIIDKQFIGNSNNNIIKDVEKLNNGINW